MKSIVCIIGISVIVISGLAVFKFKEWIENLIRMSRIVEKDVFDKNTIREWIDSLDIPEVDSSYRFFAIKMNKNNLKKIRVSKKDRQKLMDVGENKKIMALVVSDEKLRTQSSILYICNEVSSELKLDNDVTELHFLNSSDNIVFN